MSRTVKKNLCKTNTNKIIKFVNKINKLRIYEFSEIEDIHRSIHRLIEDDARLIKDCSEKNITEYYLDLLEQRLDGYNYLEQNFWDNLKRDVRERLVVKYTGNKTFDNVIDNYFNAVKAEYIRHPMGECDDLEFIPENYDIFVKNNLKTVIECAKRYQNLGLSFEDLIQAGNVGLVTALNKYDKNKANLRIRILKLLHESENDYFTYNDAKDLITSGFSYNKNLDVTLDKLPEDGFANKDEFELWIKRHIKIASFASVAFMWIRAEIIIALNQVGSLVHVPQSAQKQGTSMANIISLDSVNPYTDDCYHDNQLSDSNNTEFILEDDTIESNERDKTFKELVNNILYNLTDSERRVTKKRFGIGYPYELSVSEIADSEGLSTNKVKYILNNALKKISTLIPKTDRDVIDALLR